MTTRQRVTAPFTLYIDAVHGNDATGDGLSKATAWKTIQRAFDACMCDFDVGGTPIAWVPNVGYLPTRPGLQISLAPAPRETPYLCPKPAWLDGAGLTAPVRLFADGPGPDNYNVLCEDDGQGLTAFGGAHLIVDSIMIRGVQNCTLVNGLQHGRISVVNCHFQPGGPWVTPPIGAAMGSAVNLYGTNWFFAYPGGSHGAVYTAIENSLLFFMPGSSTNLLLADGANSFDFDTMISMMGSQAWTEGQAHEWNTFGVPLGGAHRKLNLFDALLPWDQAQIDAIPGQGISAVSSVALVPL